MQNKILTVLKYAFFLGLGLFIAWWSVKDLSAKDWSNMWFAIIHSRYWLLLPVFFLLLLSHWVRALRWKILMEPLGYHPSTINTFLSVLMGYFVNMFLPRAGEVARCSVLSRYENTQTDKLIGTIIVERSFDVICLLTVILITFFSQGDQIASYISAETTKIIHTKAATIKSIGMIFFVAIIFFMVAIILLLIKFSHLRFVKRVRDILSGIWTGLISVKKLKNKRAFLLQSIIIWLLYYLSTWVGTLALRDTEHIGFGASLSILVLGSFGMIATPNGIGAYPEIVRRSVNVYGIFKPMDIAFGMMMWAAQTFFIIIGGIVSFILLPALNKDKEKTI
jgi:uncharacterized protein (TIRG00374 family)